MLTPIIPTPDLQRIAMAALQFGPNDSSVNRGDRSETGDNEALPTRGGVPEEVAEADGIEVRDADDGRLGLTNTDRVAADDWAADTGGTAVPESAK